MTPPIVVHRPLSGPTLDAFNHMVDALRLLDIAGEVNAATDLMAAIDELVQAPQRGDTDADHRLFERLDAYLESVDRPDHPHGIQPRTDGAQASIQ